QIQGAATAELAQQHPAGLVVEGQVAAERLVTHGLVEPRGGLQLHPDPTVAQRGAAVVNLESDLIVRVGCRWQQRPVGASDLARRSGTDADAVAPPGFYHDGLPRPGPDQLVSTDAHGAVVWINHGVS